MVVKKYIENRKSNRIVVFEEFFHDFRNIKQLKKYLNCKSFFKNGDWEGYTFIKDFLKGFNSILKGTFFELGSCSFPNERIIKLPILDRDVLDEVPECLGYCVFDFHDKEKISFFLEDLDSQCVGEKSYEIYPLGNIRQNKDAEWKGWDSYCLTHGYDWDLKNLKKETEIRQTIQKGIERGRLSVKNGGLIVAKEDKTTQQVIWTTVSYQDAVYDLLQTPHTVKQIQAVCSSDSLFYGTELHLVPENTKIIDCKTGQIGKLTSVFDQPCLDIGRYDERDYRYFNELDTHMFMIYDGPKGKGNFDLSFLQNVQHFVFDTYKNDIVDFAKTMNIEILFSNDLVEYPSFTQSVFFEKSLFCEVRDSLLHESNAQAALILSLKRCFGEKEMYSFQEIEQAFQKCPVIMLEAINSLERKNQEILQNQTISLGHMNFSIEK